MRRITKKKSIICKKKSFLNLSIADAENFEPPQQSSTPSKTIKRDVKRILKDNNSLNISVINKQYQKPKVDTEISNLLYKPLLPITEENYNGDRIPELFCSDPEDESSVTENTAVTGLNDSDDKWATLLSDASENKSSTDVSDLLAEIEADIGVRFDKPPRRSYPGRKRNNKSLYEDDEKEKETEVITTTKNKKTKQKKKIDPQEEAFIRSINEHFNDVETFSLAVE